MCEESCFFAHWCVFREHLELTGGCSHVGSSFGGP